MSMAGPTRRQLTGIFALFAAGYFLSYSFRSVGPLIAPDLMRELNLNTSELGLLASVYFLTFAIAQPFIGINMDRYGPARVNAVLFVFAAAGAAVFALSHSFAGLAVGRALIGLGVSGALMAGMTAIVVWYPQQHREALTISLSAVGGAAAMVVSVPAELAMRVTGWRGVVLALGAASVVVALLLWWRIGAGPKKPLVASEGNSAQTGSHSGSLTSIDKTRSQSHSPADAVQTPNTVPAENAHAENMHAENANAENMHAENAHAKGFSDIFASRIFRAYMPLAFFGSGGYSAVQSLWAGPWLAEVEGHTRSGASQILFVYAFALFASYLLIAWLSTRVRTIPGAPRRLYVGALAFTFSAFGLVTLNLWPQSGVPWFLYGIAVGAIMLAYPVLTRAFPAAIAGRVVTAYNVVMFVGGFCIQWGIGVLIQALIDGGTARVAAYQISFAALSAAQWLSLGWFWVLTRRQTTNVVERQALNRPSPPTA